MYHLTITTLFNLCVCYCCERMAHALLSVVINEKIKTSVKERIKVQEPIEKETTFLLI